MSFAKAILRLFGIAGSVLLFGGLIVLLLRVVGAGITVTKSDFSALGKPPVILARGDIDVAPDFSRPSLERVLRENRFVPALELRVSRDLQWFIFGLENLGEKTNLKGALENYDAAALMNAQWLDPRGGVGLVPLAEMLKKYQPIKLLLIVHNKETAAAKSLVDLLGNRDENEKFLTLAISPNHRLNRELRKLRPWWLFGADETMMAQWSVFSAVGLESFIPDDFHWMFSKELPPRLREEMRRRQMNIIVSDEPRDRPVEAQIPIGILTNRPNEILPRYTVPQDK